MVYLMDLSLREVCSAPQAPHCRHIPHLKLNASSLSGLKTAVLPYPISLCFLCIRRDTKNHLLSVFSLDCANILTAKMFNSSTAQLWMCLHNHIAKSCLIYPSWPSINHHRKWQDQAHAHCYSTQYRPWPQPSLHRWWQHARYPYSSMAGLHTTQVTSEILTCNTGSNLVFKWGCFKNTCRDLKEMEKIFPLQPPPITTVKVS